MDGEIESVSFFPTVTTDDESVNSELFSRSASGIIVQVCPSRLIQ